MPTYTEIDPSGSYPNTSGWSTITRGDLPAGAIAQVVASYQGETSNLTVGVRAYGSSLNRYIKLHEAEAGGLSLTIFWVKLDSSKRYEAYTSEANSVNFSIIGYWTGVDFTEKWTSFIPLTPSNWMPIEMYSLYDIPRGRVVPITMGTKSESAEVTMGVREYTSTISRYLTLHEAESGATDDYSVGQMVVKTDPRSGRILAYTTNSSDSNFFIQGYFGPNLDYVEAFQSGTVASGWNAWDITAYLDQDGRVVDVFCADIDAGNEVTVGATSSYTSYANRYFSVHEPEAGGEHGYLSTANTTASGVVYCYAEVSGDCVFYLLGYYKDAILTVLDEVHDGGSTRQMSTSASYGPMYSAAPRFAQLMKITGTLSEFGFYALKTLSPTGDVYFRIRKFSDDSIVYEQYFKDAAAFDTSYRWETVTLTTNQLLSGEYFIGFEFSGGNSSNYIRINSSNDAVTDIDSPWTFNTADWAYWGIWKHTYRAVFVATEEVVTKTSGGTTQTITDTLALAEAMLKNRDYYPTDSVALSEIPLKDRNYLPTDSISSSDSVLSDHALTLSDVLSLLEELFLSKEKTASDSISSADSALKDWFPTVLDTSGISDTVLLEARDSLLLEAISLGEVILRDWERAIADSISGADSVLKDRNALPVDSISSSDKPLVDRPFLIPDTLSVSDSGGTQTLTADRTTDIGYTTQLGFSNSRVASKRNCAGHTIISMGAKLACEWGDEVEIYYRVRDASTDAVLGEVYVCRSDELTAEQTFYDRTFSSPISCTGWVYLSIECGETYGTAILVSAWASPSLPLDDTNGWVYSSSWSTYAYPPLRHLTYEVASGPPAISLPFASKHLTDSASLSDSVLLTARNALILEALSSTDSILKGLEAVLLDSIGLSEAPLVDRPINETDSLSGTDSLFTDKEIPISESISSLDLELVNHALEILDLVSSLDEVLTDRGILSADSIAFDEVVIKTAQEILKEIADTIALAEALEVVSWLEVTDGVAISEAILRDRLAILLEDSIGFAEAFLLDAIKIALDSTYSADLPLVDRPQVVEDIISTLESLLMSLSLVSEDSIASTDRPLTDRPIGAADTISSADLLSTDKNLLLLEVAGAYDSVLKDWSLTSSDSIASLDSMITDRALDIIEAIYSGDSVIRDTLKELIDSIASSASLSADKILLNLDGISLSEYLVRDKDLSSADSTSMLDLTKADKRLLVEETLSLADLAELISGILKTVEDSLGAGDTSLVDRSLFVLDVALLTDQILRDRPEISLVDAIALSEVIVFSRSVLASETIGLDEEVVKGIEFSVVDAISSLDSIALERLLAILDGISLGDILTAEKAILLLDEIALLDKVGEALPMITRLRGSRTALDRITGGKFEAELRGRLEADRDLSGDGRKESGRMTGRIRSKGRFG